ncbi:MAG TPA: hypothetical protein VH062_00675 [Polyangiaceae bacterium]|jgi:hypothetical protein|nr:hypothetical protein [Polyangiaceae bacterium]
MTASRRVVGRVLLVVASVLFTLSVVELALRLSGAAPLPDAAASGFRADHPLLRLLTPDVCNPMGRVDGPYLVSVCTNHAGLRDRDHAASESPRVLDVGDSFTFGWGVEQNDTFTAELERSLRLGGLSHAGVYDAGLSYTSQVHQDVLLRKLYDDVRPDLVVLQFSEDNDIDENIVWNPNNGVFPETGAISKDAVSAYRNGLQSQVFRDSAFRHSALVRFFRQRTLRSSVAAEVAAVDARLAAHGLANAPLSRMVEDEARRRFLQAFSNRYDDDFHVSEILLDRMLRFVADRHGKVVLLRIPSRMSVEDGSWTAARERFCGADVATSQKACGTLDRGHTAQRLADYAKAHSIAYVDPESELRAAVERGESMYLPEDIHLSRLGHQRVGERLAEVVVPALGGKQATPERSTAPQKTRRVGAYFYPWYRGEDWSSFTDYTPAGGPYLSTDPARIERQLRDAERGEIDFFMIELLADHNPESRFNNAAVDALVKAIAERRRRGYGNVKFAVLSDIFVGEADIATNERWAEVTRRQLDQIWTRFVEPYRDAYVEVGGKPLVGIYSPPTPIDDPRYTILRPYWVSHEQWQNWDRARELVPFWDTAPQAVTDRRFVSVTPGYNDWRLERQPQVAPYLPRLGGKTFVEQWQRVFDVDPDIALVYGFNEYFEQTQIEPTVEQGDRYLLLNRILARRFKDGRPLPATDGPRLVDALEPRENPHEEKVAWVTMDDPALAAKGLESAGQGRATLTGRAELTLDADGEHAFVVGIGHAPSFDHCAGLAVTLDGAAPVTFPTDVTQLSILRDAPLSKDVRKVKLVLERVPATASCKDAGAKPLVLTGVARYPLETSERLNFRVDAPAVKLDGFWDVEDAPANAFSWTKERAKVTISGLTPGIRHKVMLTFRDTAGFGNVDLGADAEHLERVVLTPGRTATLPGPLTVAHDGTLTIVLKTPTWTPHERFGSDDARALGLALRLVTLDRVEGTSTPRGAH